MSERLEGLGALGPVGWPRQARPAGWPGVRATRAGALSRARAQGPAPCRARVHTASPGRPRPCPHPEGGAGSGEGGQLLVSRIPDSGPSIWVRAVFLKVSFENKTLLLGASLIAPGPWEQQQAGSSGGPGGRVFHPG